MDAEKDCIIIRQHDQTEVFANKNGQITIRQSAYPDSPVLIVIDPIYVESIVKALRSAKREIVE